MKRRDTHGYSDFCPASSTRTHLLTVMGSGTNPETLLKLTFYWLLHKFQSLFGNDRWQEMQEGEKGISGRKPHPIQILTKPQETWQDIPH